MAPPQSRKKSLGRQKIPMKFIENDNARTVSFSKRRAGIFKKATELSVMCGAQIALIVFSLCGRAYSFGHPNVDSVINRFLNRGHVPTLQDSAEGRRIHAETIQELTEQCEQATEELEKTKRRNKELEAVLENAPCRTSEESLRKLSLDQLKGLKSMMENLRLDIQRRIIVENSEKAAADVAEVPGEAADVEDAREEVAVVREDVDEVYVGREESPIPPDWLKL